MKQISTTMTQRGQVTIPAEVRRKFRLKPGDKVVFTVDDDHVTVEPERFSLEDVFGSIEPLQRPDDIDELVRQAKDERAARLVKRLQSE